jgi:hypothetical protein
MPIPIGVPCGLDRFTHVIDDVFGQVLFIKKLPIGFRAAAVGVNWIFGPPARDSLAAKYFPGVEGGPAPHATLAKSFPSTSR